VVKGDFLFVYGTLRLGERMDLTRQKHAFDITFVGKDKINGKLYTVGTFPGVKEVFSRYDPNGPKVIGDVFRIHSPSVAAICDAYEGYNVDNPSQGHYDRCQVHTERGLLAWVYTYNPFVRAEQLIESGDWVRNRATSVSGQRMAE
jgi:gamma-glutamylcyclotransferase (GGCT)/AIG2-like uncharacterized protein YtfP